MFSELDMDAWMTMRRKINRGIFTWLILNAQPINLVVRHMTVRQEGRSGSVLWDKASTTSLNCSRHWSISILCLWHLQFYFQLFLLDLGMNVLCIYGHAVGGCLCVHGLHIHYPTRYFTKHNWSMTSSYLLLFLSSPSPSTAHVFYFAHPICLWIFL